MEKNSTVTEIVVTLYESKQNVTYEAFRWLLLTLTRCVIKGDSTMKITKLGPHLSNLSRDKAPIAASR